MRKVVILILISIISQAFGLGIRGSNILEYRNAREGYSYFEDRADVLISHSNLEVGARILMQQPSRYNPATASDTTFQGVDHRWITLKTDQFSVTAGTFYETFGRGLVLDLFENRRMVVDHNLDGAKFSFDLPYVSGKAVHGIADWDMDTKVQGFQIETRPPISHIGASYLDYYGDFVQRTNTYSVFGGIDLPLGNMYAEYAEKHVVGDFDDGNALYASANASLGRYSLLVEYKRYEKFWMRGPISYYNNPPPCIREPSYTLQSRYVHQQNLDEEQGFQVTHFGYYPFDISVELSFAHVSEFENIEKSYMEIYADFHREWDRVGQHLVIQYQDEKIDHEATYLTLILNGYYMFGDYVHNIQWDIEYQNEVHDDTDANYNHLMFGLEGVVIEDLSIGTELVMLEETNFSTGETESELSPWAYLSSDILEGHSIMLGYGKRAGGYTCAGGICRYELPFEGFELSISSNF